jgi:CheY-like chemotaxis protein
LRRLIGENIELRTITAADLGSVKADPGQLEQVIVNLAVNARDAMPHGGVLILQTENVTVDEGGTRPHPELLPGQYVVLGVVDTGIGMSEKTKANIFEPFFSTKSKENGAGLGLATCYGIIKQSGGHITVESELGRGTTFKVFLPRVAEDPAESSTRTRESSRPPSGGETLLVVEDELAVRELAAAFLTELGYEVLSAGNGVEALQVIAERNGDGIDLVVTDVVMPQMGGKELADNLHLKHPDLKLLFTSGYIEDAIVRNGVLEPGLTFIPKPYTSGALARKVREVLDGEPTLQIAGTTTDHE